MRARYAAHVMDRADYLFRTWHPRTRPEQVGTQAGLTWTRLTVLRTAAGREGDERGEVEFEATYRAGGRSGMLREVSRFERRRGGWVYVDGDVAEGR